MRQGRRETDSTAGAIRLRRAEVLGRYGRLVNRFVKTDQLFHSCKLNTDCVHFQRYTCQEVPYLGLHFLIHLLLPPKSEFFFWFFIIQASFQFVVMFLCCLLKLCFLFIVCVVDLSYQSLGYL